MPNSKKLKNMSPIDLLLGSLNMMKDCALGIQSHRDNAMTKEIGKITIDTVCPPDTGIWETGIEINNNWIIVEQYQNEADAKRGHERYIKAVKAGKKNFKDINIFNLNDDDED